jgi:hypothetical protein
MKNLLALLAAGLLAVTVGCAPSTTKPADKADKVEPVVLEITEIEVIPGKEAKEVKAKSGKVDSAEAPKDSGVTAQVKEGSVHVQAAKDAKPGTHDVQVKGKDGKSATLKVKVKGGE